MTGPSDPHEVEAARVIEAVAVQRELVARHLHDEAVQSISAAALRLELLRGALGLDADEVDELRDALRTATLQLRAVMNSLRRPAVFGGDLARSLRERLGSAGGVHVIDDLVRDPPEPVGLVLHWVAEECARALRIAGTEGALSLALRSPVGTYVLEVVAATDSSQLVDAAPEGAVRLAALLGGTISVEVEPAGRTRLLARIPWDG